MKTMFKSLLIAGAMLSVAKGYTVLTLLRLADADYSLICNYYTMRR